MKTIVCNTDFDITATGILGQYKENFKAQNMSDGSTINDRAAWLRARNQQRNWETINQVIALRCLPEQITVPKRIGNAWQFEFSVENLSALSDQPDDLAYLLADAEGVPMLTGLNESAELGNVIRTLGDSPNTRFRIALINIESENLSWQSQRT